MLKMSEPRFLFSIYHDVPSCGNTINGQIALYEKCGLRIVGIDPDYFTRFYPVPITENGIQLRHMVRMRIELE